MPLMCHLEYSSNTYSCSLKNQIDIVHRLVNSFCLATPLLGEIPIMNKTRSTLMPSLSPAVRNTCLAVLAAGAVVSLSACGLVNSFLGAGNVMEVGVGDCFDEAEMKTALGSGEVSEIPLIDCAEPHDAEVFYVEDLPEGDYPGDSSVQASMEEICTGSAFEEFIGVDYMESAIYVGGLSPTVDTWDNIDDREILCYVTSDSGAITESLAGANR